MDRIELFYNKSFLIKNFIVWACSIALIFYGCFKLNYDQSSLKYYWIAVLMFLLLMALRVTFVFLQKMFCFGPALIIDKNGINDHRYGLLAWPQIKNIQQNTVDCNSTKLVINLKDAKHHFGRYNSWFGTYAYDLNFFLLQPADIQKIASLCERYKN